MLRGDDGERGAEQGVGTGGVDLHVLAAVGGGHGEVHGGTVGFADPVALHELDLLGPVDAVEVLYEAMAVLGDAHRPLAQLALKTGKFPRSDLPSAVTSSLASTVPRPGHQLTGDLEM